MWKNDEKYKELKEQEKEAYLIYQNIKNEVAEYSITKLKEKYGNDFCCKTCKYSAVLNFSEDGWHNLCGMPGAPCTCCNGFCDKYQPDNIFTQYIKDICYNGQISQKQFEALRILELYIFTNPEEYPWTQEKIDLFTHIINTCYPVINKESDY